MSPLLRGLVIALVQVALVGGVGGKLLYDRHSLPRVWAETTGIDPVLPIRGRYVSLRLVVEVDRAPEPGGGERRIEVYPATLAVADGALHVVVSARPEESPYGGIETMVQRVSTPAGPRWTLEEPVAFFLPERAPDPTRLAAGETLWAEVTVPPRGPPRPIRLEVRKQRAAGAAAQPRILSRR